jgi:hypothetical protein
MKNTTSRGIAKDTAKRVRAGNRGPLGLGLSPLPQTIKFGKATRYTVVQNSSDDQVSRPVLAVVLIVGNLERVVAPAASEGKVRRNCRTALFEKIDRKITELLRTSGDRIIELKRFRLAGNRCSFFAFPATLF